MAEELQLVHHLDELVDRFEFAKGVDVVVASDARFGDLFEDGSGLVGEHVLVVWEVCQGDHDFRPEYSEVQFEEVVFEVLDEVEDLSVVFGVLELGAFFELVDEDVEQRDVNVVDEVDAVRPAVELREGGLRWLR